MPTAGASARCRVFCTAPTVACRLPVAVLSRCVCHGPRAPDCAARPPRALTLAARATARTTAAHLLPPQLPCDRRPAPRGVIAASDRPPRSLCCLRYRTTTTLLSAPPRAPPVLTPRPRRHHRPRRRHGLRSLDARRRLRRRLALWQPLAHLAQRPRQPVRQCPAHTARRRARRCPHRLQPGRHRRHDAILDAPRQHQRCEAASKPAFHLQPRQRPQCVAGHPGEDTSRASRPARRPAHRPSGQRACTSEPWPLCQPARPHVARWADDGPPRRRARQLHLASQAAHAQLCVVSRCAWSRAEALHG